MPSNHLILCHPLLLPPSIFPSIRVFASGSVLCIRWPKYWSFNFNISFSNEYSGLISFRNGLVESPCSSRDSQESSPMPQFKASILRCSAFFIVQLSHPHMTSRKTIALTRQTFVGKVVSLLFNTLSRFVIACSFSSKDQASFNFMAAVTICSDFGTQENKICHCFHFFPTYLP